MSDKVAIRLNHKYISLKAPSSGALIRARDAVLILLRELQVKDLYSKDGSRRRLRNREGALSLSIGDRSFTISWATDREGSLKASDKFKSQLLYVGKPEDAIVLECDITETDVLMKKKLGKIAGILKVIASVVAIPVAGPIAAGIGVAASVINVARSEIEDDIEMSYTGSLAIRGANERNKSSGGLREGNYEIIRKDSEGDLDLAVKFEVKKYRPKILDEPAGGRPNFGEFGT